MFPVQGVVLIPEQPPSLQILEQLNLVDNSWLLISSVLIQECGCLCVPIGGVLRGRQPAGGAECNAPAANNGTHHAPNSLPVLLHQVMHYIWEQQKPEVEISQVH